MCRGFEWVMMRMKTTNVALLYTPKTVKQVWHSDVTLRIIVCKKIITLASNHMCTRHSKYLKLGH